MKTLLIVNYSVWLFSICCPSLADQFSRTNFDVKRFEVCNNNRGLIKLHGNITKENGRQYATFNLISPIPWDDNLGVTCLIETEIFKNTFTELFTIREKNMCKAASIYLGEFWYDIERAAQHPPRVCPIPPGNYHVRHLTLDFTKISLQTFPFGTIRFTFKGVDNRNKNTDIICVLLEVENKM